MSQIRQLLMGCLLAIHSRVYTPQAVPKGAQRPYLVLEIGTIIEDGEGGFLAPVDVDGWDDNTDTTELETLMEAVKTGLNKKTIRSPDMIITLYLDNVLALTDDDPRLRRRKHIYQAHGFGRS